MKSVLFPFIHQIDFKAGYAWSLELATRLQGQLSIFTAVAEEGEKQYSTLHQNLIDARQFYTQKSAAAFRNKNTPPVVRNFTKGDYASTLLHFIQTNHHDVMVIAPDLMEQRQLSMLINSGKQIICLPEQNILNGDYTIADRADYFVEVLHQSACYNLPSSFYKTVSEDKSLFNSIASFFKRFDASALPVGA